MRFLHLIFLVGISLWSPTEITTAARDAQRAVAMWNQFYPQQLRIADTSVARGTLNAAVLFEQAWGWSDLGAQAISWRRSMATIISVPQDLIDAINSAGFADLAEFQRFLAGGRLLVSIQAKQVANGVLDASTVATQQANENAKNANNAIIAQEQAELTQLFA